MKYGLREFMLIVASLLCVIFLFADPFKWVERLAIVVSQCFAGSKDCFTGKDIVLAGCLTLHIYRRIMGCFAGRGQKMRFSHSAIIRTMYWLIYGVVIAISIAISASFVLFGLSTLKEEDDF